MFLSIKTFWLFENILKYWSVYFAKGRSIREMITSEFRDLNLLNMRVSIRLMLYRFKWAVRSSLCEFITLWFYFLKSLYYILIHTTVWNMYGSFLWMWTNQTKHFLLFSRFAYFSFLLILFHIDWNGEEWS